MKAKNKYTVWCSSERRDKLENKSVYLFFFCLNTEHFQYFRTHDGIYESGNHYKLIFRKKKLYACWQSVLRKVLLYFSEQRRVRVTSAHAIKYRDFLLLFARFCVYKIYGFCLSKV